MNRRGKRIVALLAVTGLAGACSSHLSDEELLKASVQYTGETVGQESVALSPGGQNSASGCLTTGGDSGAASSTASSTGGAAVASGGGAAGSALSGGAGGSGRVTSSGAGATAAPGKETAGPAAPGAAATPGSPGTPGAPAASTSSVIKLGTIGPRSGPFGAALQVQFDGMKAWVADVNARGGLKGHPVQLIEVDDRGDPNQSLALTRRLVEQDRVLAFYGLHTVTTSEAIMPYLEERKVPVIGSCICIPQVRDSPMLFDVGDSQLAGTAWEHIGPMIEAGKKPNLALLYCREAGTCSLLAQQVKVMAEKAGISLVYEAQVSLAQPDFTAEVIQARQSGAEAVITISDNATVIRVARSAHRQNYNPIISLPHAADDRFPGAGGADVEGAYTATPVADWTSSPLMEDYRTAFNRYTPNGARGGVGPIVWTAGKLIEKIAESFPAEPTSQSFLDGLHALRGETLGGRTVPISYVPGQSHENYSHCSVPLRIENGKFVAFKGHNFFTCPPGWKPVQL